MSFVKTYILWQKLADSMSMVYSMSCVYLLVRAARRHIICTFISRVKARKYITMSYWQELPGGKSPADELRVQYPLAGAANLVKLLGVTMRQIISTTDMNLCIYRYIIRSAERREVYITMIL
jgi:hypothetical protein